MFNIVKVREETDITGAGDTNDDKYVDAPTKGLVFEWKFLQNGATDATLAHLLTQMGTVLQIKDKSQGLIADYGDLNDLYYDLWFRFNRCPRCHGNTEDDNNVITIALAHWFGDPLIPYQGLNASGLTSKVTTPASANNLDTDKLSIFQLTCPKARFTEFIKHEKVDYTPTLSGWKLLPLHIKPLTRKILYLLFYQTTGRDDSTTDTITIDQVELWKDGNVGIGRFYADWLINLFSPTGVAGKTIPEDVKLGHANLWPGNYVILDFKRLNNGYPYIPRNEGVQKELALNIYGGDANAVRMNQFSLIPQ